MNSRTSINSFHVIHFRQAIETVTILAAIHFIYAFHFCYKLQELNNCRVEDCLNRATCWTCINMTVQLVSCFVSSLFYFSCMFCVSSAEVIWLSLSVSMVAVETDSDSQNIEWTILGIFKYYGSMILPCLNFVVINFKSYHCSTANSHQTNYGNCYPDDDVCYVRWGMIALPQTLQWWQFKHRGHLMDYNSWGSCFSLHSSNYMYIHAAMYSIY